MAQPSYRAETYSSINFEIIRRDSTGKKNEPPKWNGPSRIQPPIDTFMVYENNDSIRMITTDAPMGNMFRKIQIHASRWKPKPQYGNELFFIGTYEREGLAGMYFSFYAGKSWGTLMQVVYTNPGNLTAAILFSKDSVNVLQKSGIIVDPNDELSEPETAKIERQ